MTAPMLSKDWVLGERNVKKLTDSAHLALGTPRDKIDRRWIRALVDTVANDKTIDDLASLIQKFRDGFFERHNKQGYQPFKQQKVADSNSQRCPLSPATSTFMQDSYLDPDCLPSQHCGLGHAGPSQGK